MAGAAPLDAASQVHALVVRASGVAGTTPSGRPGRAQRARDVLDRH
jgi:hypothetical protein